MAVVGVPKVFDKKFAFRMEIDGLGETAFSKVSALEVEVAEIKQYEGGALIPNKSAGRLDFKDLTLERGATRSRELLHWFALTAYQPISIEPWYKRHCRISQLDRGTGFPIKTWHIFWAWPKSFTGGEWDNGVDENVIEKVTLAYDYFIRVL